MSQYEYELTKTLKVVKSAHSDIRAVIGEQWLLIDFGGLLEHIGCDKIILDLPPNRNRTHNFKACCRWNVEACDNDTLNDFEHEIIKVITEAQIMTALNEALTKPTTGLASKKTINENIDLIIELITYIQSIHSFSFLGESVRELAIKCQNPQLALLYLRYKDDSDTKMRQIILESGNAEYARQYRFYIDSEDTQIQAMI